MNHGKQGGFLIALFLFSFFLADVALQGIERGSVKAAHAFLRQETGKEKNEGSKGDPAAGKQVFEANCAFCHSAESEEAMIGPGLKNLFQWPPHKLSDGTEHEEHTVEIIRKQVVEGGGAMEPMGATLTDQELSDLISYLQTL